MVTVRLENVTKRFGKVVAVDNANLEIRDKEFMALLGPSGSGKSTLLYLIAGIYKPTRGRIYFDGTDVTELPPKERNIGLVFQNWALYPHMRVFDNIAFPLELKKESKKEIRRKVTEVAKMLKIDHLLERYPYQLSGGQQQRVAIARALVKEPGVLLLDEPLSNLDALLRMNVRAELKRLQKELGITAIYVTHDQAEALAMADKIAVIKEGEILQVGTPDDVYAKPWCKFVGGFLGNPPMNFIESVVIRERGELLIGESRIPAPPKYAELLRKFDISKVLVGFRPHDAEVIDLKPNMPDPPMLVGEVFAAEPLGRETIVTVILDDETYVKVFASKEQKFDVGDKVGILLDLKKVLLFDKETELVLERAFEKKELS